AALVARLQLAQRIGPRAHARDLGACRLYHCRACLTLVRGAALLRSQRHALGGGLRARGLEAGELSPHLLAGTAVGVEPLAEHPLLVLELAATSFEVFTTVLERA